MGKGVSSPGIGGDEGGGVSISGSPLGGIWGVTGGVCKKPIALGSALGW
ncbi:hypothetical protein AAEJ74_24225 [Limnospira fusiformis PMC 851.14]|uniref:Uncharacterized protein n=1 Tax=Limnospira fusiformis PMC 851.14 TaxID=2219512 RepID=A0ABU9ERR0_LIMFS